MLSAVSGSTPASAGYLLLQFAWMIRIHFPFQQKDPAKKQSDGTQENTDDAHLSASSLLLTFLSSLSLTERIQIQSCAGKQFRPFKQGVHDRILPAGVIEFSENTCGADRRNTGRLKICCI